MSDTSDGQGPVDRVVRPAAEALRRAYYYTELGGWRGPEVDEDERWMAVAQAAQGAGRTKALQDAARWVDEEVGHAVQDGGSVEALVRHQPIGATIDICDELEARWGTVHSGAFNAMRKAKREIERLREWISEDGKRTDTCTRNVLGKVCENCRCGKAADA